MWGLIILFFLFAIAVTGLVLGALAIARDNQGGTFVNSTLVHPTSGNFSGKTPMVSSQTGLPIANVALSSNATDTSGLVDGQLAANTTGVGTVTFGVPFASVPKSVSLTLATSGINVVAQVAVTALTTTSFTFVIITGSTGVVATGPLFYYNVL